jgi:hypothetical protein
MLMLTMILTAESKIAQNQLYARVNKGAESVNIEYSIDCVQCAAILIDARFVGAAQWRAAVLSEHLNPKDTASCADSWLGMASGRIVVTAYRPRRKM